MVLPEPFKTFSPVISSYDWVDLESGEGIVAYYAGGTIDSTGTTYKLDNNLFQAYPQITRYVTTTSYVKAADLDFDTGVLNMPRQIYGDMLSEIPVVMSFDSTAAYVSAYVVVILKRILSDGSTEEILNTTTSGVIARTNSPAHSAKKYFCFNSSITTPENIARGEKIRITIELWAKHENAGGGCGICFDPYNREIAATNSGGTLAEKLNGEANYTQAKFLIPFRVQ